MRNKLEMVYLYLLVRMGMMSNHFDLLKLLVFFKLNLVVFI